MVSSTEHLRLAEQRADQRCSTLSTFLNIASHGAVSPMVPRSASCNAAVLAHYTPQHGIPARPHPYPRIAHSVPQCIQHCSDTCAFHPPALHPSIASPRCVTCVLRCVQHCSDSSALHSPALHPSTRSLLAHCAQRPAVPPALQRYLAYCTSNIASQHCLSPLRDMRPAVRPALQRCLCIAPFSITSEHRLTTPRDMRPVVHPALERF